MEVTLLTCQDYRVTRWSGGDTTELFLYPPDGSYQDRRFDFRLSSATVELEHSVFTSLPGVQRHITPLTGPLDLSHKGQYEIHLEPLEVDSFSGDWETECHGAARDFNLMTTGQCRGAVHPLFITSQGFSCIPLAPQSIQGNFELFYFPTGGFQAKLGQYAVHPPTGGTLVIRIGPEDLPEVLRLINEADKPGAVLRAEVCL